MKISTSVKNHSLAINKKIGDLTIGLNMQIDHVPWIDVNFHVFTKVVEQIRVIQKESHDLTFLKIWDLKNE